MDATSRRMTIALKTAIIRERRTAAAYEEKMKRIRDPKVKSILGSLAKLEHGHAKKLERVLAGDFDLSKIGKTGKELVARFHLLNDDIRNLEKQKGAAKVIARAIKAEENSSRYYRSLEKIYKGVDLSLLFRKLADEEEKHKIRLEMMMAKL